MLPLHAPTLHLLLEGDAARFRDRLDLCYIVLVLLYVIVRLVEFCQKARLILVRLISPAVETHLARTHLRVVGARGVLKNVLYRLVEPATRDVLVVDIALNDDGGHLATSLVRLIVYRHLGHGHALIGIEGALQRASRCAAHGLPLHIELLEHLVVLAINAHAVEHGLDHTRDV